MSFYSKATPSYPDLANIISATEQTMNAEFRLGLRCPKFVTSQNSEHAVVFRIGVQDVECNIAKVKHGSESVTALQRDAVVVPFDDLKPHCDRRDVSSTLANMHIFTM